ncbi:hypothetical protein Ancab_030175 [Ancistrocladus abbreviatus]
MAPTPSKPSNQPNFTLIKTPSSKHRLPFNSKIAHPSPNPNSMVKEKESNNPPPEHPVEVIGRIRDYPNLKNNNIEKPSSGGFQINPDRQTIRVRTEIGYRDFTLDGVSSSEEEDLEGFYKKFIESRIIGVKMGAKCTIMMYGPTGSGKSHTMFGGSKQPGIVYRSLKDILGEEGGAGESAVNGEEIGGSSSGLFVRVTVLEIYNEEIYDLLSTEKGGGFNLWPKGGSASKVRLEVMGKKVKNASFIAGNEAVKISKEIQKVEKRRIVKSTNCNDRSSRSHCMIILDVPTVGGRLMLVDMAGSENIEQAGQVGLEAKMQTAKINQGNIALKRVVESIANGDSHVPFRDSKLTMLLQDSFEDDKSKILMILCASPDPREMHKTISTLEYGAKAKCIIRGPHTPPVKDEDSASTVILGSRIAAMDQLISKLQMENKKREKEENEAHKQLLQKEEEVSQLRMKLKQMEGKGLGVNEEEINEKVNERTQMLKQELEKQLQECQRMAKEYVELEKRRMEERILQQQQEVEILRQRLQEMEIQLSHLRDGSSDGSGSEFDGSGLAKRLLEIYSDEDMEKSMDLDMGDQEPCGREVKIIGGVIHKASDNLQPVPSQHFVPSSGDRMFLSTVFEEEEIEEEDDEYLKEKPEDEEVQKEVIEEKRVLSTRMIDDSSSGINLITQSIGSSPQNFDHDNATDAASSRKLRIQNIFTLCGNHRELSHTKTPGSSIQKPEMGASESPRKNIAEGDAAVPFQSPCPLPEFVKDVELVKAQSKQSLSSDHVASNLKENVMPVVNNDADVLVEIYVKWEATKESTGKFISKLKVMKDASLADLRKLIDIHLGIEKQDFTFLALGDPTGAPVPREREATTPASKLPACSNQLGGHLACLRPAKHCQSPNHVPFSPIGNKLPATPVSFPTTVDLNSTPYITVRRH